MSGFDLDESLVDRVVRRLGARVLVRDGQPTVVIESQSHWPDLRGRRPAISAIFCVQDTESTPTVNLSRVAFLDIETTGLNAGAGTLVFVVGIASVRDGSISIAQFFLHEPATEPTLLRAVEERLREFDRIVTFNGQRFDLPLLLGRFEMHRFGDPTAMPHVDLLHLARRIWSRRLRPCNLSNLESRILGLSRVDDLPGREAPGRYFAYLHDRDIDGVLPVVDHNRSDLISMVWLADHIGLLLSSVGSVPDVAPGDHLCLGALFGDLGRVEEARWCYEAALVGGSTIERAEALFRLAHLVDRDHDLDRAEELLMLVSSFNVDWALLASIELAKIHEHRRHQPEVALMHARRALSLTRSLVSSVSVRHGPAVSHRINRLETKAKRGRYPAANT